MPGDIDPKVEEWEDTHGDSHRVETAKIGNEDETAWCQRHDDAVAEAKERWPE